MSEDADQKIEVSEIMDMIVAELERTRMKPKSMDAAVRKHIGARYSIDAIFAIMDGKTTAIPRALWRDIQTAVKLLPDAPKSTGGQVFRGQYGLSDSRLHQQTERIEFTPALRQALEDERQRTGVGAKSLLHGQPPEFYVSHNTVYQWLNRSAKTVRKDQYEYVMGLYRGQPDKAVCKDAPLPDTWISITDEMHRSLMSEKNRTQIGAISLIRRMKQEGTLPTSTLSAGILDNWFKRATTSAREDDFKSVMAAYERIEKAQNTRIYSSYGQYRVEMSDEFIARLNTALDRGKNFSVPTFLRRSNPPKGLTARTIARLLNGTTKTALPSHFSFLELMIEHLEKLNEN